MVDMDPSLTSNLDDYSPSSTIINFDRSVPLLRGPIPAGTADDLSAGPYVLAFKDSQAWAAAYRATESRIIKQCQEGARIGCAISASNKCKPPWWRVLIGGAGKSLDLKERELCEEREMDACYAAAKEKCNEFAKEKCLKPFSEARIAVKGRRLNSREAVKLVSWVSMVDKGWWVNFIGLDFDTETSGVVSDSKSRVTNYRASELIGFDHCVDCILGESGSKV